MQLNSSEGLSILRRMEDSRRELLCTAAVLIGIVADHRHEELGIRGTFRFNATYVEDGKDENDIRFGLDS